MQRFGIDLSRHNSLDLNKIANSIDFVILKIGGGDDGLYRDSKFKEYYKQCEAIGISKGCYFFGQAMTIEEADKEADYILNLLKGYQFDYPIFYDVEAKMLSLDKRALTNIIKRVCSKVESEGHWVGIYSSVDHFNDNMYDSELKKYSHWVASWCDTKPKLLNGGETQMWQFGGETNEIRSPFINGVCIDQNYCYTDYPSLIKQKGLNGYTVTTKPTSNTTTKKTNEEVAKEVIKGVWGNGTERKNKLQANGYNYSEVQKIVNAMVKGTYENRKSNRDIALEVINGKWGNGSERKRKLEMSGYDYKAIQTLVNEMLKV